VALFREQLQVSSGPRPVFPVSKGLLRRREVVVGPGVFGLHLPRVALAALAYPGLLDFIPYRGLFVFAIDIKGTKNLQPDEQGAKGIEQREKMNIEHRTSLPAAGRVNP